MLWQNPEYRKRMSDAHKGYKMPNSQKQKIREASIKNGNTPPSNKGKKYSQEFKDAISKRMIGVKKSPESIVKANLKRIGKKHTIEHRIKIGIKFKGEKHWNWQGGKTQITKKIRNSIEYKIWRESVFKRDNYTCQECKKRGCTLNADHIKPFAYFIELRFDITNGRTLCVECHKKTDTYGKKCKLLVKNISMKK